MLCMWSIAGGRVGSECIWWNHVVFGLVWTDLTETSYSMTHFRLHDNQRGIKSFCFETASDGPNIWLLFSPAISTRVMANKTWTQCRYISNWDISLHYMCQKRPRKTQNPSQFHFLISFRVNLTPKWVETRNVVQFWPGVVRVSGRYNFPVLRKKHTQKKHINFPSEHAGINYWSNGI